VPGAMLWNYDEVLDILRHEKETVVLVMAGHFHRGGYAMDSETGTHHVTMESPLQTVPETPTAHCTVEVWRDRVEIKGSGITPSRTLPLRPVRPPAQRLASATGPSARL